jgi:hypothetical protein
MDDIVKQGMAKWPNVPAVYGWLSLDARGNWLIKGDRITNPVIAGFIGRNYLRDDRGGWYFQNGPQRVFVSLEYTPFVVRHERADTGEALLTHTGQPVGTLAGAWLDDHGRLVLATDAGAGVLHDRDLEGFLFHFTDSRGQPLTDEALESALETLQRGQAADLALRWREALIPVQPVQASDVPARFGFVRVPDPPAGEEVCT